MDCFFNLESKNYKGKYKAGHRKDNEEDEHSGNDMGPRPGMAMLMTTQALVTHDGGMSIDSIKI